MKTKTSDKTKIIILSSILAVLVIAVVVGVLVIRAGNKSDAGSEATKSGQYDSVSDQTESIEDDASSAGSLKFSDMPKEFTFCSGVGGWMDVITLHDDGTFDGDYHDSDIDEFWFCIYNGKFGTPQKINDYSYSMKIESLKITNDLDKVYYGDDVKYNPTEPYGLENAKELTVYLPGTPLSKLTDDCVGWLHLDSSATEIPGNMYVLYNTVEGYAFVGTFDDVPATTAPSATERQTENDLPLSKSEIVELFKKANNVYYGTVGRSYDFSRDFDDDDYIMNKGDFDCYRWTGTGKYSSLIEIKEELEKYFSSEIYQTDLENYFVEKNGNLYIYEPLGEGNPPDKAIEAKLVIKSYTVDSIKFQIVYTDENDMYDPPEINTYTDDYKIKKINGRWIFVDDFDEIGSLFVGVEGDYGSKAKWSY